MSAELRIISSMATRTLLADLSAAWMADPARPRLHIESVGGVDAARRVQGGEAFDAVVLSAGAIGQLLDAGLLRPGSVCDLVRSGVAVAVPAGAPRPGIGSEQALRQAVLSAATIGYSTGPSGVALLKLFDRWGIGAELAGRLRQAPPGVPVGTLVARGEVALGFQQLSELLGLAGIDILGPLPDAVQITTVFSGGVCGAAAQPEAAAGLLRWMAAPEHDDIRRRHGMESAR